MKFLYAVLLLMPLGVFAQANEKSNTDNSKRIDELLNRIGKLDAELKEKNLIDSLYALTKYQFKEIAAKDSLITILKSSTVTSAPLTKFPSKVESTANLNTYVIIGAFNSVGFAKRMAANYPGFTALPCNNGKYYYTARLIKPKESIEQVLNEIRSKVAPEAWVLKQ